MKKIRILFTIPNFLTAGSGREMFNIIERLDKNVFEPFIVVNEAGGNLYEEIVAKNYPVLVHRFAAENTGGVVNKIKEAKILSQYYKPYGFRIWQSFNWSSDYTEAIVARLSGAKYVYVKKNMNWNRKAWKVKSILASAIVARNMTMMNKMFSGVLYNSKTYLIGGAVDTSRFFRTVSSFRQTLNIPEDATLVTCIAQIVRVKDQATVVKAVADMQGVYLILAGRFVDEVYTKKLNDLINELGVENRVLLIGNVTDVNALLNATDIFVLPTSKEGGHEEGSPVALLEAMAARVPCIASDVAGSNDLIKNEQTGLLFSTGNEAALKNCIERYITDKAFADKMAQNASVTIHKKHTLDIEVQSFAQIYFRLADKIR